MLPAALDGLRGPLRLRLASACNHRPGYLTEIYYNKTKIKSKEIDKSVRKSVILAMLYQFFCLRNPGGILARPDASGIGSTDAKTRLMPGYQAGFRRAGADYFFCP